MIGQSKGRSEVAEPLRCVIHHNRVVLLRNFTTSLRNNAHFRSANSTFQFRNTKASSHYLSRNQPLTLYRPAFTHFLYSGYPSALVIRYRRLP